MWGSIAEWISAIAALGALVAAVFAARVSKRLFVTEIGRDAKSEEREIREQASRVAAWCAAFPPQAEGERLVRALHILNSSDEPVYEVEVCSTYSMKQIADPEPQKPLHLAILPPGELIARADAKYGWGFPEDRQSIDDHYRPVTKNSGWRVTELAFTDAHGIRWVRSRGSLHRVQT